MKTKQLQCAYLYADGHAVLMYEKTDADCGRIQFVEIYERWTNATLRFDGRLVFGRYDSLGLLRLAKLAKVITAKEPSVSHGSENTRKLNIAVGSLEFDFDGTHGRDCAVFRSMPGLISANHNYQPECIEAFDPNARTWGITPVARVHRNLGRKSVVVTNETAPVMEGCSSRREPMAICGLSEAKGPLGQD